ncbi:MAG: cyclic nucleotide-binding domain-containing protein [Thauera sp.]|jgi:CRP/FNR family transcriptional regulator, cyclic AMP receptor protein|nr:cyclic nucleotide-binding domain-containing protein [Thauera sp.]
MEQMASVSVIALKTFPLFQGLEDAVLEEVAGLASMRRVARSQVVVTEGDRPDNVYFVLNGNLKVVVSDEEGREVILSILGQGEIFGEMGMFEEQPRSASVVAASAADLVVIRNADFRSIMRDNFEVSWRLMCMLASRLRNADRKIESLALMDVYGRVARLLMEMAEMHGDELIVIRKISKQDIAKMIGASREMVSRVMKDLGQQGLIEERPQGILIREQLNQI